MSIEQSIPATSQQNIPVPNLNRNLLQAAKGGAIIAAGRLFAYGARFVLAFLLARGLGAEQYGLYTLALSTATLVAGIAMLGMGQALVRYVAILSSRRDEEGLWGALQVGVGFSTLASVVLATGLFALAYPIATNIFHEPGLAPLLQLFSAFIPFMTLSLVLGGATRGFKKMEYSTIANTFVQLIFRLVLTAMLFVLGFGAIQAVIIFGVSNLIATVLLLIFLNKEFSLKRPLRKARRDIREITSFSAPLWITNVLRRFRSSIQTLLLGSFASVTAVGVFSIVSNVSIVGGMSFITTSTKPIIAEVHARGDMKQLGGLYRTTSRWAVTLNLPIILALILFREEILSIFGQTYLDGAAALVLLALSQLVHVGTGICGTIIDMTGHSKLRLLNSSVQLVVVIGLNLLLIPRWGLIGAAIAALVGVTITNSLRLFQVWFLFRLIPYDRSFVKPILAAVAATAAGLVAGRWLPGTESVIVTIVSGVAIVFMVYFGLLILLRLPPEERTVFERLQRRVKILSLRFRTR